MKAAGSGERVVMRRALRPGFALSLLIGATKLVAGCEALSWCGGVLGDRCDPLARSGGGSGVVFGVAVQSSAGRPPVSVRAW